MKKIINIIILLSIWTSVFAQFKNITPNDIYRYLYTIEFSDSNHGLITYFNQSNNIALYKTENGGNNLSIVNNKLRFNGQNGCSNLL